MKLFIDKIVVKLPKGLCLLIGIPCLLLSLFYMPYTQEELYIEGVISEYVEDVRHVKHVKGGEYDIDYYFFIINSTKIYVASSLGEDTFKGQKEYWKKKLEGKYAKVYYSQGNNVVRHIELEDGSYSYHDPHEISYYDVGWFPFCITAPIALFCIFVLLRYFYLQTFASDERRILVFGNKDGDLK